MDWTSSSNSSSDGDWLSAVVKVGTALYAGNQAKEANDKATQLSREASERAAATSRQATEQATGAITSGNASANARLARLEEQGQPGVDYLRTVVAQDPTHLTTQDQQQLEDARRISVNQLAGSGLRGSGRAVTGMLRRVNEGGAGQIIQNNRARQGNAATALANMSTGATTGMSTIDRSGGASVADLLRGGGNTQADFIQDAGNTQANATLANGNIANSTLGAISGIFASDERNRQREERYGKQYGGVTQ